MYLRTVSLACTLALRILFAKYVYKFNQNQNLAVVSALYQIAPCDATKNQMKSEDVVVNEYSVC
jgi:hypothetical protein